MNVKRYRQVRVLVAFFVAMVVAIANNLGNYVLAVAGVVAGMMFLGLARSKTKVFVDEREKQIRERAANMTYSVFAPTLGLASFILLAFARGRFYYLESLGTVFAYLTLFMIAVYAVSFYFINRKMGGGENEE